MKKINIAIDGYSSCGKSTLAKAIAKELHYTFIDTGAMYRAVTLFALENGIISENKLDGDALVTALPSITVSQSNVDGKTETALNGKNVEQYIRTMEVSGWVSEVSKLAEVRKKLVQLQQQMGEQKGVVMDGRDIGTVVFPNAELKLFMTADNTTRAQRRYAELQAKQPNITLAEVKQNLEERDYQDTHRANDPLRQADNAIVLDNSNLTPEEQLKLALELVEEVLSR